jgi:hypothetical protein
MKITLKNRFEYIISFLTSVFISGVFLFNSPLHPWVHREPDIDSSVFKTVSMMMREGYLPYRDSFDHKGPLLYFFNLWGDCLSEECGVLFFELLSLSITVFAMYKIARLFCGIIPSTVSVFAALSMLFVYYEGGNFTEEYAMPFISVSLLYFLSYIKERVISDWMGVVQNIPAIYKDRNSDHLSATMTEVVDIIQELTDENDSISVYGNWNAVYVLSAEGMLPDFHFNFL